jgi:hypothetical protein
MVVAISSTVNLVFGSQVIDPVTGILFNDEVCDVVKMTLEGALEFFPRWMIFLHQAFRMHLASGLRRVGACFVEMNYVAHHA